MKVTLETLDPRLQTKTRAQTTELHQTIGRIKENEAYHGKLLKIATFVLPDEQGKAHGQKQNMVNFYGNTAEIDGLTFSVARSVDNSEEYLGVVYSPEDIVDGAWDAWQEEKAAKAVAAKERKEQRDVEAQLKAEFEAARAANTVQG